MTVFTHIVYPLFLKGEEVLHISVLHYCDGLRFRKHSSTLCERPPMRTDSYSYGAVTQEDIIEPKGAFTPGYLNRNVERFPQRSVRLGICESSNRTLFRNKTNGPRPPRGRESTLSSENIAEARYFSLPRPHMRVSECSNSPACV